MFLHIGANMTILNQEVIAILNYETIKKNPEYQQILEKIDIINNKQENKIKSVIITREEIYFSAISSLTLQKRADISILVKEEAHDQ